MSTVSCWYFHTWISLLTICIFFGSLGVSCISASPAFWHIPHHTKFGARPDQDNGTSYPTKTEPLNSKVSSNVSSCATPPKLYYEWRIKCTKYALLLLTSFLITMVVAEAHWHKMSFVMSSLPSSQLTKITKADYASEHCRIRCTYAHCHTPSSLFMHDDEYYNNCFVCCVLLTDFATIDPATITCKERQQLKSIVWLQLCAYSQSSYNNNVLITC